MAKIARILTPIGPVTLAAEKGALIALWLEGQRFFGEIDGKWVMPSPEQTEITPSDDSSDLVLLQTVEWLRRYFAGERPNGRELSLAPRGSDFRRLVWETLLDIPYGGVITYGQLAAKIAERRGRQVAPLAIGGAVGHNPIALIIPCHRVVTTGGKIGGYGGGFARKEWLLGFERGERLRSSFVKIVG